MPPHEPATLLATSQLVVGGHKSSGAAEPHGVVTPDELGDHLPDVAGDYGATPAEVCSCAAFRNSDADRSHNATKNPVTTKVWPSPASKQGDHRDHGMGERRRAQRACHSLGLEVRDDGTEEPDGENSTMRLPSAPGP